MIAAAAGTTWQQKNMENHAYIGYTGEDIIPWFTMFIQRTGTWILLFTNFVPISLLVTLELVKVWQARFMECDQYLIDSDHGIFTNVQSSNLNEELGQIEYIFSDKTGTLTRNEMIFKKFVTNGKTYDGSLAEGQSKIDIKNTSKSSYLVDSIKNFDGSQYD